MFWKSSYKKSIIFVSVLEWDAINSSTRSLQIPKAVGIVIIFGLSQSTILAGVNESVESLR